MVIAKHYSKKLFQNFIKVKRWKSDILFFVLYLNTYFYFDLIFLRSKKVNVLLFIPYTRAMTQHETIIIIILHQISQHQLLSEMTLNNRC